jgi:repressor LexA
VRLIGFAGAAGVQPVPYYGAIQGSEPALVAEHRKGFVTLDRRFLPSEHVFMLKVKDHSMTGRGILDGDYVMVDPAAQAKDGDVVAARIGADATVKSITYRGSTVVLESANESEQPVEIDPNNDFAVLGVVCGVFRPYWEQEPAPTVTSEESTAAIAAV